MTNFDFDMSISPNTEQLYTVLKKGNVDTIECVKSLHHVYSPPFQFAYL